MQVIKIHHPLDPHLIPTGPVVLAMGFFDGVHRGHQAVIRRAKKIARQRHLPLAVLTYTHAPGIVYRQYPGGFKYLSTVQRKLDLLQQLGVNRVYLVSFTSQFANQSPQVFVDRYLVGFHSQVVVAGFDHTYGPATVATMAKLPDYARGRFEVVTVPKFTGNGQQKIGSRVIRQQIDNGQVQVANNELGYYYTTTGLIVHGLARGRTLGFPTINIETPTPERLPGVGVYATTVLINKHWYGGMASVGHNVTFGDHNQLTLEIYLFDFNQLVYGEEVRVRWYQYLRGEEKFSGAKELVAQLKRDEQAARRVVTHQPVISGQSLS